MGYRSDAVREKMVLLNYDFRHVHGALIQHVDGAFIEMPGGTWVPGRLSLQVS